MNHAKELNDLEKAFRTRFNQLHKLKQEYDLQQQDILHFIEFEKYDAPTGSKILKKLKEIRQRRREIKDEYEELQSILRKMKNAGLHNYIRPNKSYVYRTTTLEDILR